jgi:AbrB family looped-hinge helix DNA binding protein
MSNGRIDGMRTTIDSGGRIVVPKRMRDLLGLVAGSVVEVELDGTGGALRIKPAPEKTVLERVDGVLVAKAPQGAPPISQEAIREILEATRDRRM